MNVRGSLLRRLAYGGARYGPRWFVATSPAVFGAFFAAALPAARHSVLAGHRRILGVRPAVREQLDVLRTFVGFAHCLTESLAIERPEAGAAAPLVVGGGHLDDALARGRGVVLLTAHTGAWDVAARWLFRERALSVLLVMSRDEDAGAGGVSDAVRERVGVRVVHVGGHPLDALPILRHLRGGGVVAVQLDRLAPTGDAVAVDVDGRALRVPLGPFQLAALAGAPLVPVFTRRLGYFRYEVDVRPPIDPPRRGDGPGAEDAAARAAREMYGFLRAHPTQWFHFAG